MGLTIEFIDGRPSMELASRSRLRVTNRDAAGSAPIAIAQVTFSFQPIEWGRVLPSEDPSVGILEVVQVHETKDVLLAPTYAIEANLTVQAGHTFQSERHIRVLPAALEVELAFEVGDGSRWTPFTAQNLTSPIDWSKARVGDSATQALLLREGIPYLRITPATALPAKVEITFPNGDVGTLVIEGPLTCSDNSGSREARGPTQRLTPSEILGQKPKLPPHLELRSAAIARGSASPLREELAKLHRYIGSFSGSQRTQSGSKAREGIRERIRREIDRVEALIEGNTGSDREELRALFRTICQGVPEGLG